MLSAKREDPSHRTKKRLPGRQSAVATTLAHVLGLLGLMASVTPSAGADTLICIIDDPTLRLELNGSTSLSGDTRIYVRNGNITLKPSAFSKEPADIPLMQSNLILQWILGRSLRLGIHVRRGLYGETLLVTIQATRAERSAIYRGSYVLKLMRPHDSRSISGRIQECVAD